MAFLARGSSQHAAAYGAYLLEHQAGISATILAPSLLRGDSRIRLAGHMVIAVSQSGMTPEIVAALHEARNRGAFTVAVTNDSDAPLGKVAEVILPLEVGAEHAIPATKTFTASAAVMASIARRFGARLHWIDLIPDLIESALRWDITELLNAAQTVDRIVVASRADLVPIADEIGLKLTEAAGIDAHGGSANKLLHGPIELLGAWPLLLLWHPNWAHNLETLAERFESRGSAVTVIGDPHRDHTLGWRADAAANAFPLAVLGQRLALEIALSRGLDPDSPGHLNKITTS